MSLLDGIENVQAGDAANYLKEGRTILKITRVSWREATPTVPKASFRIDGQILKTSSAAHANQIGCSGTMNLSFRYPEGPTGDKAKMKKAIMAAGTVAGVGTGEGGDVLDKEVNRAFVEKMTGVDQPLVGAVVAVNGTTKDGKPFTHYSVEMPTDQDLEGLDL